MKSSVENNLLIIRLEGRIDSSNAQETQEEINRILKENPGMDFLFDAENLSYISSAGLRILLSVHKTVKPGYLRPPGNEGLHHFPECEEETPYDQCGRVPAHRERGDR